MQWVGWMDGIKDFEVDSNMRFSDIIVPTMDTVRGHFQLELLITNFKQVKDFTIDTRNSRESVYSRRHQLCHKISVCKVAISNNDGVAFKKEILI